MKHPEPPPFSNEVLLPIPEKRYFTIGEVAKLCCLKPHVLRYWESQFPHLCPIRNAGGRRVYSRKDIDLIRKIRVYLYRDRFTIEGAQAALLSERRRLKKKPSDQGQSFSQSQPQNQQESCFDQQKKSAPAVTSPPLGQQFLQSASSRLREIDDLLRIGSPPPKD